MICMAAHVKVCGGRIARALCAGDHCIVLIPLIGGRIARHGIDSNGKLRRLALVYGHVRRLGRNGEGYRPDGNIVLAAVKRRDGRIRHEQTAGLIKIPVREILAEWLCCADALEASAGELRARVCAESQAAADNAAAEIKSAV